jgi:hypothetical protein
MMNLLNNLVDIILLREEIMKMIYKETLTSYLRMEILL